MQLPRPCRYSAPRNQLFVRNQFEIEHHFRTSRLVTQGLIPCMKVAFWQSGGSSSENKTIKEMRLSGSFPGSPRAQSIHVSISVPPSFFFFCSAGFYFCYVILFPTNSQFCIAGAFQALTKWPIHVNKETT